MPSNPIPYAQGSARARLAPALVTATLLGATVLAGCGGASPTDAAGSTTSSPTPGSTPGATSGPTSGLPPEQLQGQYEKVVRSVLTSVVQINTSEGLGSGIVFDRSGHIVTNAHVVGSAHTMQVTLATGGKPMKATLVSSFPTEDLAVIKVDGNLDVAPAEFADSSKLAVGEIVLAMGNPLGLSGSVTDGIVSALGRTVSEGGSSAGGGGGGGGTTIPNMIQTSAAINPGNSGGALVDLQGRVVGIPTLGATDPNMGGGAAPGLGFAIPSNRAQQIAKDIIAHGKVTQSGRAELGIGGVTVSDDEGNPAGVGVVRVESGSGAQKAGIRQGDVIVGIGDTRVRTVTNLQETLAVMKPGDKVTVHLTRGGRSESAQVTLGQM